MLAYPACLASVRARPGHRGLGVGENRFGRGLTVAGVHHAGLNSFQCPSEMTSTLPPVTLMAV
jgi:ribosomal protein L13E